MGVQERPCRQPLPYNLLPSVNFAVILLEEKQPFARFRNCYPECPDASEAISRMSRRISDFIFLSATTKEPRPNFRQEPTKNSLYYVAATRIRSVHRLFTKPRSFHLTVSDRIPTGESGISYSGCHSPIWRIFFSFSISILLWLLNFYFFIWMEVNRACVPW